MGVVRAALVCGLLLLVNLTTVVASGYGDPDDFILKRNANGGHYRAGHALTWETRSKIVALWLAGHSVSVVARQVRCAHNTVKKIVQEFTTSGRLAPRAQTGGLSSPPKLRIWELLYIKVRRDIFSTRRLRSLQRFLTLKISASRFARSPSSKRGLTSRAPRLSRDCASISTSS